ncbi:hypothetical protein GCM10010483_02000 [Actinokineospora diospyrosa]
MTQQCVPRYVIGEPGRAAALVVPRPSADLWGRKDTVLDGFQVDSPNGAALAYVRAASVRGLSHRAYAKVRQDAYGVRVTGDGRYLVVAVADGLSAGALSHVAADTAVNRGIRRLNALLTGADQAAVEWAPFFRDLAADVERDCRDDLFDRGVADANSRTLPEIAATMATTVSFAVLDLIPFDSGHRVVMGTVGDTSVWVLGDGGWQPTQPVKNDGADLHSSATHALPLPAEPVRAAGWVRPGEALVVMTDGVGDPLGHGTGEVGARLAQLWRTPPHELEFTAQVGFARKTYDDDRTVVAVWPARG